jgi:hypothetical protein
MAKSKTVKSEEIAESLSTEAPATKVDINSLEWNDYVLSLLSDEEKIKGNPTTEGLRRIFEIALDCTIINARSTVVQAPSPENEKRATVVHSLTYILNGAGGSTDFNLRTVDGTADVYWGNCDKVYRNHPVAVAETRAEGRALRRGLRLRKVVAAEEVVDHVEDDPDGSTVNIISEQQLSCINQLATRANINIKELLLHMSIEPSTIRKVSHAVAVDIIRQLSKYQQDLSAIPVEILGYSTDWRSL